LSRPDEFQEEGLSHLQLLGLWGLGIMETSSVFMKTPATGYNWTQTALKHTMLAISSIHPILDDTAFSLTNCRISVPVCSDVK
jgi:hypothetical protein